MRRSFILWVLMSWVAVAFPAQASSGRVIKVLPLLLDSQGRHALSPSLYERDAYQAFLRQHPEKRAGMLFAVQWKAKVKPAAPLVLRIELRGSAPGSLPKQAVLEQSVQPGGWLSKWTALRLSEAQYRALDEVTAWRATLWEGNQLIGEQQSFLWQEGI